MYSRLSVFHNAMLLCNQTMDWVNMAGNSNHLKALPQPTEVLE